MAKSKKKKAATANKMALAQRARRERERKQGHIGVKLKKKSTKQMVYQAIGNALQEALHDGITPSSQYTEPVSDVIYETPTETFISNLKKERESLENRLVHIDELIAAYNK